MPTYESYVALMQKMQMDMLLCVERRGLLHINEGIIFNGEVLMIVLALGKRMYRLFPNEGYFRCLSKDREICGDQQAKELREEKDTQDF